MGLRDLRTLDSFVPRRGRDVSGDRRRTPNMPFGTIRISRVRPFIIFRAPYGVKIIRASLLVDTAIAPFNESYWSFQLVNLTNNQALNVAPVLTSAGAGITANLPFDIPADTGSVVNDVAGGVITPTTPATIPSQILKANDVLGLIATKVGSPTQLSNLEIFLEYEVTGLTTTTSSSTTTTTTTSTSTSSTTSTTTTTSTTSSTSSSTTSTSTSTTTTTTTTTSTSSTTTVTTSTSSSTSITTSSTTSTSISTTTTLT